MGIDLTLLKRIVPADRISCNEALAGYTTFKVGGPADFVVRTTDKKEIADLIGCAVKTDTPYIILGNGSNVLVSDNGFGGLVIIVKDGHEIPVVAESDDDKVILECSAGCGLTRLAMEASRMGLTGLEFAAGIPGSVGGAVVMNAGAYGGEIKDCLVSAQVLTKDRKILTLTGEELELSYRHSVIPEKEYVVLSARFGLKRGNPVEIMCAIEDFNLQRRTKQPLEYPSAGSTFKRPTGYFAGKLIEDSGLKGMTIGGACVSEKHCGFVINKGGATAADIYELIEKVSEQVFNDTGVRLEAEVKFIGF